MSSFFESLFVIVSYRPVSLEDRTGFPDRQDCSSILSRFLTLPYILSCIPALPFCFPASRFWSVLNKAYYLNLLGKNPLPNNPKAVTKPPIKAKLFLDNPVKQDLSDDADWQVHVINKLARQLVNNANSQLKSETSFTAKTFTAAT